MLFCFREAEEFAVQMMYIYVQSFVLVCLFSSFLSFLFYPLKLFLMEYFRSLNVVFGMALTQ